MTTEFDIFDPSELMSRDQLRVARRLLSALRQQRVKIRLLNETSPSGRVAQRLEQRSATMRAELNALSAQVLADSIGLHKYMVVSIKRDDGYEARLQVLDCAVDNDRQWLGFPWVWELSGRALRKDGSLGKKYDFLRSEPRK